MQYILNKIYDGTFTMNWIGTETSTQQKDIKIFESEVTKGITKITNFNDTIQGATQSHYFVKYFDYSNSPSGITWSEKISISGLTNKDFCPFNDFYIRLYYYRIDSDRTSTPTLSIKDIVINGEYSISETSDAFVISGNTFVILKPTDIYKVFSLTGFEIFASNPDNLNIKFRFTQNGGRTYTPWEPLTTENISTVKLNEVRFAQVEYLVESISNGISQVFDINLIGDFQNISANYLKTNRYGLKEDCATRFVNGTASPEDDKKSYVCLTGVTTIYGCGSDITGKYYDYNKDFYTQYLSCYLSQDVYSALNQQNNNPQNQSSLWNPYDTKKISDWYNLLANQTNQILGWDIEYYKTDPDAKAIDNYYHEYPLHNVIDVQKIKIIVPENQFPDNQVVINAYGLDLFDSFEIHVLKDVFKSAFGIEKRPDQKDYIYFCQTNRMYRVKHAQIFKDVMYMGIYYKVVLEKYEDLANEQIINERAKKLKEQITNNTQIDELFGFENRQEENKIANKKQLKPLTHEYFRNQVNEYVEIKNKQLYNNSVTIANGYYDFSDLYLISGQTTAVTYQVGDYNLEVSDNRSFTVWFNFNNKFSEKSILSDEVFDSYYVPDYTYFEFLDNFSNNQGYRLWYSNGDFGLSINDKNYTLSFSGLTTNIWYGLLVNFDNRQRTVDLNLYKRNCDYYITFFTNNYSTITIDSSNISGITYYTSLGYKPVKNVDILKNIPNSNLRLLANSQYADIENESFTHTKDIILRSSDFKITNIRIFDDVIPNESKSNILNQHIIRDSNHLILSDNADRQIYARNIQNINWE